MISDACGRIGIRTGVEYNEAVGHRITRHFKSTKIQEVSGASKDPTKVQYMFLLVILIPLIEIYVFIKVGSWIGAGYTILLVLGFALGGVFLLRKESFATLHRARENLARGSMPAMEVLEGLALFASGILLLTPGFLTDIVAFLLLVPVIRRSAIRALLLYRFGLHVKKGSPKQDRVIEGRVERDDRP